jgi:hypothetical protein
MTTHRTTTLKLRDGCCTVIACALSICCLTLSTAQASTAEGPTIVNAEALDMTEHGAKLELKIDPHDADASYEAWIECQEAPRGAPGCEPVTGGAHEVGGTLPLSSGVQTTTVEVTGLEPAYRYLYRVAASNAAGRTEEQPQLSFETFALGACREGRCPYASSVSLANIESAEREARAVFAEAEAHRRAVREQEERNAREYAMIEGAPTALTGQPEGQAVPQTPLPVHCVVPLLRGDTLHAARRSLGRHHCRLGKVRRPRHYTVTLHVTRQSPGRGERLASGAVVAVTLGAPRPQRRGPR